MIFTLIAPLLAHAALQDPPPDSDRARYEAATARWRKAAAVDAELQVRAELPAEDGEEPVVLSVRLTVHLARPLHGWVKLEGEGEGEEYSEEWIADGKKLYLLDHEAKTYAEQGNRLSDLFVLQEFAPLEIWASEEVPEPLAIELAETDPARPGVEGLEISFDESFQILWVDADNNLVSATLLPDGDDVPAQISVSRWSMPEKVDLDDFTVELPEGYTLLEEEEEEKEEEEGQEEQDSDMEAGLLPVGASAPDVSMKDLDGSEVTLADMRGKTVLLNFWFRH